MFDRTHRVYARGFMAVQLTYGGSDQRDIESDLAFFPDKIDAERFLAENGYTRDTSRWASPGDWRGPNQYIRASIRQRELEIK